MDALIPPGSLDRIRRVRDWTVEANDLDNWGVVGMYGGFGLVTGAGLTAGAHAWHLLGGGWIAMLFVAYSSFVRPFSAWPATLPVHPWERSIGAIWAWMPRSALSILLHAVAVVLCEPIIGLAARAGLTVWPAAVEVWDIFSGHPLGVVHGQLAFDVTAWSPGDWAARAIACWTIETAVKSSREGSDLRFSPPMFLALLAIVVGSWPVALATTLAATAVAMFTSTERDLPLTSWSFQARPSLRKRRHVTGLMAVARDALAIGLPGEIWAAAKQSVTMGVLFASRVVRAGTRGGWGAAALTLAAFWLFAPGALGGFVLGAPAVPVGEGQLAGAMQTLPIRSRRYVASRVAQAVPALILAVGLHVWEVDDRIAWEVPSLVVFVTMFSLAASFMSCPVNLPLRGDLFRGVICLVIASLFLRAWTGIFVVAVIWLVAVVAVTIVAARRILQAVP